MSKVAVRAAARPGCASTFDTATKVYGLSGDYVFWLGRFVRFHRSWHPRAMSAREIEAFLPKLATERACSTLHPQAGAGGCSLFVIARCSILICPGRKIN